MKFDLLSSSIIFNRFSNSAAVFCNSWHDCSSDDLFIEMKFIIIDFYKMKDLLYLLFLMNFSFKSFDFWWTMWCCHIDKKETNYLQGELGKEKKSYWKTIVLFKKKKRNVLFYSIKELFKANKDWDKLLYVEVSLWLYHRPTKIKILKIMGNYFNKKLLEF